MSGNGRGTSRTLADRWWAWALLALVLASSLLTAVVRDRGASTNEDRVTAISETISCPVCDGQSVASSDVELSKAIRADIAERVQAGQSDGEIRAHFAGVYGDAILLTPSGRGVAGLVWIVPVVALGVAVVLLVVSLRRSSRRGGPVTVSDEDRALVARALEGGP
ncbi:MAG: cytochrome c-type biogenesis protein CcmH [Acidimicrobiales bacterium]|nr:cytochrome c-type biogenesis protein CcmH [Acidimicrobiales bacterium]